MATAATAADGTVSGDPSSPSGSIIKGNSGRESRVDANGNKIVAGGNMRCSFRDELGQGTVSEVKEITAYKSPYLGGMDQDSEKQGCACTLL